MPTYEYRCKSCGHGLEVVQSFTDEPLTKCPNCKKKQLKKVFGSIGITFKGSGFYKTDSKGGSSSSTGSKPESKSDSGGSDSTSSSSSTSSSGDSAKSDSSKSSSSTSST